MPSCHQSEIQAHSSVHAMNRKSSHAVPLSENEYCQLAVLDQALRFLLRPSLQQSCGWPPLRSDQLFEEILLCALLHADWLSRVEGHSCIIFMATKKKFENNRGQTAFKDILVRARLSNEGNGGNDKKGCSRCGKSRCQVCNVMSNSEHFHSNIDSREYRINYSFNCDSSNVVYLLECTVCGVQYVGSTCTPFRLRFNNYKACSRKFNSGASVPQVEFFRHFTEEGHHGVLKDISVKIIDRLTGGNRMRESFWQYGLESPGNLPQTIERWMIRRNKWNPFPPRRSIGRCFLSHL